MILSPFSSSLLSGRPYLTSRLTSDITATMSGRMHTHYMGLSGPGLRFAISLTAGLCFVAFGYGQGDIGGLIIMKSFREQFPRIDGYGDLTAYWPQVMVGVVIATWNLGCFVGAMLTVVFGDRLGRRGSALLGLSLEVIGKIIQTSSFSLGQYIAGRVIAGIGNGYVGFEHHGQGEY